MGFSTPVAFIVFNRPKHTRQTFERIAEIQPETLFVIADGPRSDRPGEAQLTQQVRQIVEQVDWDCDVYRHYADENLGLRERVSSGITWVFDQVEQAIILEDDCVPDPSFFPFCEELLKKYKDCEDVMMISGTNFLGRWKETS